MRLLLACLAPIALSAPAVASSHDLRSIAGMQGRNRVVLSFAPALSDARIVAQGRAMAQIGLQAAERDLVFVQVDPARVIGATDKAETLRRRYRVPPDAFRTLLIGKDGQVALTSDRPIASQALIARIEAMPMRQAEVRRARAGLATTAP